MKITATFAPLTPLPATSGFIPFWVLAVSLLAHSLVIFGVLQTGRSIDAPPQLQAVIVDLILDQSGASPDKETRSEPKQKAVAAQSQSSSRQSLSPGYLHTAPEFVGIPIKSEHQQAEQKKQPTAPSMAPRNKMPDILRTNTATRLQVAPGDNAPTKPESVRSPEPTAIENPVKPDIRAVRVEKKKEEPRPALLKPAPKTKPKDRPIKAIHQLRRKGAIAKKRGHASRKAAPGAGQRLKGTAPRIATQGVAVSGRGFSNPRPSYPAAARSKGYQGRVLLVVIVNRAGRARSVRLQKSSGHVILDQAAITAVKKWRFRPARRNGRPVQARLIVPVNFRLRG